MRGFIPSTTPIRSEESQRKLDWGLVDAVGSRDWKKAGELIGCGADANARNAWGHPVLITIAAAGPKWLVDLAVEKGGNGEIEAHNGWTPKRAAAEAGNTGALESLRKKATA